MTCNKAIPALSIIALIRRGSVRLKAIYKRFKVVKINK
nr:MAG TPA: hypothetical protein [Caudoviricetes sp.]